MHLTTVGCRSAIRVEACGRRERAIEKGILSIPSASVEVDNLFVVVGRERETAWACKSERYDGEGKEGGGNEGGEKHGWGCDKLQRVTGRKMS